MRERPVWRWWLFCVALEVYWRAPYKSWLWDKSGDLMAWCVLPAWLGYSEADAITQSRQGAEGAPW